MIKRTTSTSTIFPIEERASPALGDLHGDFLRDGGEKVLAGGVGAEGDVFAVAFVVYCGVVVRRCGCAFGEVG